MVVVLIFINIACFWLVPQSAYAALSLNILFFEGFYWQPISSMFLHANATHLILNMLMLFQFGFILEKSLGALKFALLYMLGGLLCSLLSAFWLYFEALAFNEFSSVVGASGAICVLIGFYAYFDKRATLGLFVAVLLMSFVPLLMGVNVAWYAHIFGLLCGYLAAKLRLLNWAKGLKK